MTGLGSATDALVNDGIVRRTREADRVVLETPARRDYWFGHGFVLDAPPDAARASALIEEGRARFAALGAARFVVQWECALDAPDDLLDAPHDALRERSVVMVYDGPVPDDDPRVTDHDAGARWDEAASLASEEYPEHGDFTSWRFACLRDAVRAGRARSVGIRENGRLLNTVGLYRGDGIARFVTPVTRPAARGRGLFCGMRAHAHRVGARPAPCGASSSLRIPPAACRTCMAGLASFPFRIRTHWSYRCCRAPCSMADDVFLETPRLVLRDKRPGDFDFIASLYADENVMRWIGDGTTLPRDEVEARFARVLAIENEPGHERWDAFKLIVRKADGVAVGQAGMLRCAIDGAPEIEIGWWLAPFAWGHGYATEAASALRDFAFAELRLDHLSVVLQAENARSVAVARRIGGMYTGQAVYRDRSVTRYVVSGAPPRNLPRREVVQPFTMLKRDLTTSYPRSVRDESIGGVVQLGRAVDKGIALANGLNGEYNYDCPMDKGVLEFLGIDGDALLDVIKNAKSESEIEAYVKPFVDEEVGARDRARSTPSSCRTARRRAATPRNTF